MSDERPLTIPWQDLPPATLRNVLEDFCTRDGTDYGAVEKTLDQKVALLRRQLERGEAIMVFEQNSQQVGIVHRRDLTGAGR